MRSVCGIVPVYNNHQTIEAVVKGMLSYVDHVIVVDDGSHDGTEVIVDRLGEAEQVLAVHLPENQGKGAAVQKGLHLAHEKGFDFAVQVDGDGQHCLEDIPKFIQAVQDNGCSLVVGLPQFGEDIPFIRKHGRKLTNYAMAFEMGTFHFPDGNCGFRLYPVQAICEIGTMGQRMDWDPEVLVRASWAGIKIIQVPTKVRYLSEEEGGISHFRMVKDNVLHTWLHIRLILQAPFRWLMR